jgi:hypothetical protein
MKTFIFTVEKKSINRLYGGCKEIARIYRIKNNKPVYVGQTSWNTASYRGAKSEVFNKLIDIGQIPKKYYHGSVCEWRGAGYYAGEVTEKYNIWEVV